VVAREKAAREDRTENLSAIAQSSNRQEGEILQDIRRKKEKEKEIKPS